MAQRSLAKKDRDARARGIELSRAERVEAWLLTGPAGRVWSFGRDAASALPLLASLLRDRIRRAIRGEP